MDSPRLLATAAAAVGLLILPGPAEAEQGVVSSAWRNPPHHGGSFHRRHGIHRKHGFAIPVFIVQREPRVIIEREVVREVPVVIEAPEPPPPPREPYVVGKTYATLPGGCMKLIEAGASYYLCSGEWYRQVGKQYRAVARP